MASTALALASSVTACMFYLPFESVAKTSQPSLSTIRPPKPHVSPARGIVSPYVPASAQLTGGIRFSPQTSIPAKAMTWQPTGEDRLIISEDFNKMTLGSIDSPDATSITGNIDPQLTSTPGWVTATGHQAGGCLYIDDYAVEHNGQTIQVRLLDTPLMTLTKGQDLYVTFRAKSTRTSDTVYALGVDASTSSTAAQGSTDISGDWGEHGIYLESCPASTYIELQSDKSPLYIDDVKVYAIAPPAAPEIRPATDITDDGFTANWSASSGAEGYVLQPVVTHVADGIEPYYIINSDFSKITEGSIENPVLPQYVVESLSDFIDQPGWVGRMVLRAGGYLGLTNNYLNTYGNSLIQSPVLDLSADNGEVNIEIKYVTPDVDMFQDRKSVV